MWADLVTLAELEQTLAAADALANVGWAKPLLERTAAVLARCGVVRTDPAAYRKAPITASEQSLLFEIRFARDLALRAAAASYEFAAGVANTTIDFRIPSVRPWLVELVSLHESDAFKAASWKSGAMLGYMLHTDAEDPRQSGEGELLKAQERIVAKVFDGKRPIKFPESGETLNMLMVDARGFMGDSHGDVFDWNHLAYGASGVPVEYVQFWTNPKTGQRTPIAGLFESHCPLRGGDVLRSRIHAIGFVCEKSYGPGEITTKTIYRCNPGLFANESSAQAAMSTWPLLSEAKARSAA